MFETIHFGITTGINFQSNFHRKRGNQFSNQFTLRNCRISDWKPISPKKPPLFDTQIDLSTRPFHVSITEQAQKISRPEQTNRFKNSPQRKTSHVSSFPMSNKSSPSRIPTCDTILSSNHFLKPTTTARFQKIAILAFSFTCHIPFQHVQLNSPHS